MGTMRELLHPPDHRGPLIATGAVLLTVGVALEQLRVSPGAAVQLVVAGALAAASLWLVLQRTPQGGPPAAHESALLVCGLLALYVALLRLANVLGADLSGAEFPAGAFLWTGVLQAGAAAWISARHHSAVAGLIAAVALAVAVLSGWDWVFEPGGVAPFRWLLLVLAIGFAVASLAVRGVSLRHADQMANAAGLAVLAIAVLQVVAGRLFFLRPLPGFWELVLLAGGLGLVAYAAGDRAPGPACLGVLVLAVFVAFQVIVGAGETLRWWPLLLLAAGAAVMAAGLRPRATAQRAGHPDDLPVAARTEDVRVRVHRE